MEGLEFEYFQERTIWMQNRLHLKLLKTVAFERSSGITWSFSISGVWTDLNYILKYFWTISRILNI